MALKLLEAVASEASEAASTENISSSHSPSPCKKLVSWETRTASKLLNGISSITIGNKNRVVKLHNETFLLIFTHCAQYLKITLNAVQYVFLNFSVFNSLLSFQNVNVARFARNVECDFFCNFQTL